MFPGAPQVVNFPISPDNIYPIPGICLCLKRAFLVLLYTLYIRISLLFEVSRAVVVTNAL